MGTRGDLLAFKFLILNLRHSLTKIAEHVWFKAWLGVFLSRLFEKYFSGLLFIVGDFITLTLRFTVGKN